MRAISHHPTHSAKSLPTTEATVQTPYFQARDFNRYLELEVLLPGISADSVRILIEARDLVLVARQPRPVRANWQAAHFEAVQADYEMRFYLGHEFDARHIRTKFQGGILNVRLPKTRRQWPTARSRKAR